MHGLSKKIGLAMQKSLIVIGIILVIAGWLPSGRATEATAERRLDAEYIEDFLTDITGVWQGKAVFTPVGPLPYDISFAQIPDNGVEGVADPGAAIHVWRFIKQDDGVKLRFLTTFRGNREPIYLLANTRLDNAAVFRAREPSHLEVHVNPAAQELFIKVFLRNKLHVEILFEK
jgi:hypothetical protein